MQKRLLCGILCLCLLLCSIPIALADTITGTVFGINAGSKLYVRESPVVDNSITPLDKLVNNDIVTILETVENDGRMWYKVTTHNNITGYASAEYIRINQVYENDEAFELHLTGQQFPEDYKEKLRQLHAYYPQWIFTAQHLPMTWAEALTAETLFGINTTNQGNGWKSMEYGCFDWSTGAYVDVDGGYVTAAPSVVAYFMDPRNFLDLTYVFQFENLTYDATHTLEGVQGILPDRFDVHAEAVLQAAQDAQVNAYFLATRMTQEGSRIDGTLEAYPGIYNFFNIGAWAHSGNGAVTNGAIYAQNKGWDTPYKCIYASAQDIGLRFISRGQNTLYYQKFNMTNTVSGYYKNQYMTNVMAPYSEGKIRADKASDADKSGALHFIIPVYKDMPATAAPQPSQDGDNNNFLTAISVSGCTIGPTFDRYTMQYTGAVAGEVTSVDISVSTASLNAPVTGVGTVQLLPGDNYLPITVTAPSGETRTYTLTITRHADIDPSDMPVITGTAYTVDGTISKVQPNTLVDTFLANLGVQNGTPRLFSSDGAAKTSVVAATGDIVRLYSGNVMCAEYPVVVHGDVNGDGKASSIDLRMIQKHILSVNTMRGYALTASDVNRDGKISSIDLRMIQKFILGVTTAL